MREPAVDRRLVERDDHWQDREDRRQVVVQVVVALARRDAEEQSWDKRGALTTMGTKQSEVQSCSISWNLFILTVSDVVGCAIAFTRGSTIRTVRSQDALGRIGPKRMF